MTEPLLLNLSVNEKGYIVVPVGIDHAGRVMKVTVEEPTRQPSRAEVLAVLDRTAGSIPDLERPSFDWTPREQMD